MKNESCDGKISDNQKVHGNKFTVSINQKIEKKKKSLVGMVKKFCTHLNMKKKKATQIKNEKKFKKCDLNRQISGMSNY